MIDLFNQTKHAHWNLKGHEFMEVLGNNDYVQKENSVRAKLRTRSG